MPNRPTHQTVGALAGGAMAAARAHGVEDSQFLAETIGGIVGGWVGGVLPDILEPATSPHHRKVMHSVVAAGGFHNAKLH